MLDQVRHQGRGRFRQIVLQRVPTGFVGGLPRIVGLDGACRAGRVTLPDAIEQFLGLGHGQIVAGTLFLAKVRFQRLVNGLANQ